MNRRSRQDRRTNQGTVMVSLAFSNTVNPFGIGDVGRIDVDIIHPFFSPIWFGVGVNRSERIHGVEHPRTRIVNNDAGLPKHAVRR